MVDPLTITIIIASVSALCVSILTHIKYSSCMGFKLQTTNKQTPPQTPITPCIPINNFETTALLRSEPIKIKK